MEATNHIKMANLTQFAHSSPWVANFASSAELLRRSHNKLWSEKYIGRDQSPRQPMRCALQIIEDSRPNAAPYHSPAQTQISVNHRPQQQQITTTFTEPPTPQSNRSRTSHEIFYTQTRFLCSFHHSGPLEPPSDILQPKPHLRLKCDFSHIYHHHPRQSSPLPYARNHPTYVAPNRHAKIT